MTAGRSWRQDVPRESTEGLAGPSKAALLAWSKSFLAGLDDEIRDALLGNSVEASYPAGAWFCRGEEGEYRVALIHHGRIRAKIMTADGREVTTRDMTAGQITAVTAMMTHGSPAVSVVTVTDCSVSLLDPETFRGLMLRNAALSYRVAVYLAESTYETIANYEDNLFGSVQQRVSRLLMDMATPTPTGLLVRTDQSELASAIGSVREVVARELRKLSDMGAIRRSRRQIWVEDPALLGSLASKPLGGWTRGGAQG